MITLTEVPFFCELLSLPDFSGNLNTQLFQFTPTKNGNFLIQFFSTFRNDDVVFVNSTIEYRCGSTITPYNDRQYLKILEPTQSVTMFTSSIAQITDYTTQQFNVEVSGPNSPVTIFTPRLIVLKISV